MDLIFAVWQLISLDPNEASSYMQVTFNICITQQSFKHNEKW